MLFQPMTSFHTNLAFDPEWATPGEPTYVNRLSHAMLSCRTAFHDSTPFAFSLPSNAQTVVASLKPEDHRTGSLLQGGLVGSRYEKRDDFCS